MFSTGEINKFKFNFVLAFGILKLLGAAKVDAGSDQGHIDILRLH
ncbi:hypothetical protein SMU57_05983 [Streptococcus mutans NMT4863]|nr:hypothetical protein SMU57_05983 [Streptococcus mutans NMT4863]